MLFMQPVVVNDAAAVERGAPAEVRMAEPRAAEQQTPWTGALFAQSSLDSRSPFGANAVDRNDVTPPAPAPHSPTDTVTPPATTGSVPNPASSPGNPDMPSPQTPPGQQTDAGPPVAATPSAATPGTAAPGSTNVGAGASSGTTEPAAATRKPSQPSPSATLPGGNSGASNSR